MAANPGRRVLIADTALEVLALSGAGGLTHRVVDTAAGLPAGTTSNFYRTRLALLEAATLRMAELHWEHVALVQEALKESPSPPAGRAGVAAMLAQLLVSTDPRARARNLARIELFLEGKRWPQLRQSLEDIYAAAMRTAQVVLDGAGVPATPEQVHLLSRLLRGLLFDQLTVPGDALDEAAARELIGSLLTMVLGEPE
ncbi:TetR/AcrR family transcriptional regulator [Pseudonocardia sp. TRM90224]|uniref:TetR/AcrR family transcriptional regulator n=1 Tax=Pseudonocardia sp. TRM90224 TaxID=2812678 RepID=UPI001E2B76AC|nr:TetR/AcrR family transcriptional regulator [Pseudonocardia sp. TRM90224]